MIDLHSHILYGLDDGAKTRAITQNMLRVAEDDGIKTMVATPHYIHGSNRYDEQDLVHTYEDILEWIEKKGIKVRLLLGQELLVDEWTVRHVKEHRCRTLAGTEYVLVEFPMNEWPIYTESIIDGLMENGYRVLIAHPERYPFLQDEPQQLLDLIQMGCLVQVNAGSLTGRYGVNVQAIAKRYLEKNWVHVVATDAHSDGMRKPVLSRAYDKIVEWTDEKKARQVVIDIPKKILDNQVLDMAGAAQEINENKKFDLLGFMRTNRAEVRCRF